jgi:hypothetical protein
MICAIIVRRDIQAASCTQRSLVRYRKVDRVR